MNQSLIALLVNGKITYRRAMELSTDPEDLSLKLRKLFPQIEEEHRGGSMASDNDFSAITQLMDVKRLYEEQEEKTKLKLAEKDEQMNELHKSIHQRDEQIEELKVRQSELGTERERLKGDYARLRQEAQEKIDKLMERIKDLNQRLMGGGEPAPPAKSGIFR